MTIRLANITADNAKLVLYLLVSRREAERIGESAAWDRARDLVLKNQ